ncbi:MAG: SDR family NAD(P)-dependent oxidoreductase, partial [Phyllobacteriaceae bacterium]|nr:SDR family NAD(P)-dependent oxidoreductase [Phyllobacteriaceae bacterium]
MTMADPFSLAGRVALVTGASSGLGRHFAGTLAGAGATVIVTARRLDRLVEVVAEIEAAGGRAHALALDVTDAASVAAAFEKATTDVGLPDVVVANAGIAVERPVLNQSEADWDAVIDTNLKGCWLVAQEAARRLVTARRAGAIVAVASILGVRV